MADRSEIEALGVVDGTGMFDDRGEYMTFMATNRHGMQTQYRITRLAAVSLAKTILGLDDVCRAISAIRTPEGDDYEGA